jgi:hypothetical protein
VSDAPKLVRRLAAASVVALVALVLVAWADATPKTTKFVSKRYHYSLVLLGGPGRWANTHATGNWPGDYPPSFGNTDFDRLYDNKTGHSWLIAAKRVPAGMTLEQWTAYTMARLNSSCTPLPWRSNAKLGGAPARRYDVKCPEGRVIILTTLHDHRGYFFNCIPGTLKRVVQRVAAQRACSATQRSFHYTSG